MKTKYYTAIQIGNDFCLSSQEVNYFLMTKGLYNGEPGAYYPTEKGKEHCIQNDYNNYNSCYTITKWDSSIYDMFKNMNPQEKNKIREDYSNYKKHRNEEIEEYYKEQERKKAEEKFDLDFYKKVLNNRKREEETNKKIERIINGPKDDNNENVIMLLFEMVVAGYCCYKIYKYFKAKFSLDCKYKNIIKAKTTSEELNK